MLDIFPPPPTGTGGPNRIDWLRNAALIAQRQRLAMITQLEMIVTCNYNETKTSVINAGGTGRWYRGG